MNDVPAGRHRRGAATTQSGREAPGSVRDARMIRRLLRRVTFDHIAIAFVVVVTAGVYYLAADALLRGAASSDAMAAYHPTRAGLAAPGEAPLGGTPASAVASAGAPVTDTGIASVFGGLGYDLDAVRTDGEVPRVFMASLPSDLPDISVPEERKIMFIETTLPLILYANELIALDRHRIADLRDRMADGVPLSDADRAWLDHEASVYGLDRLDIDELLRRVDVIPPSLALAQSAEESGWGTSRVAQQGNALFGQRIWSGDGERYRIVLFDQLIDAVKSYALNLNSHPAYAGFRRARAAERRADDGLDGFALAGTLVRYSERGAAYVRALRKLIRSNALDVFDRARLGDRVATAAGSPDA